MESRTNNHSSLAKSAKDNQVLKKGVQFQAWKTMLLTALLENDLAGHVFHDLDWVDKVSMPSPATYGGETTPIGQDSPGYKAAYKKWKINNIKAFGCITSRLDLSIRLNFGEADKSAKELYDTIATT
uniref:Uncharacterized protein n=1 Tax=Passalora fulva TaxID=5499 RepID=A0A9Q8PLU7_PASFU